MLLPSFSKSLPISTRRARLSIARLCGASLFWAISLVACADTDVELAELDPIEFQRLDADAVSFAIMAANLNAAAASGNITNDVAWIRDFLAALKSSSTSYQRIRTEPYISSSTANINFGTFLNRLLSERGDAGLATPQQTYLYQVRDLLRALTNVTTSAQSETTENWNQLSMTLTSILQSGEYRDYMLGSWYDFWQSTGYEYSWTVDLVNPQFQALLSALDGQADATQGMANSIDGLVIHLETNLTSRLESQLSNLTARLVEVKADLEGDLNDGYDAESAIAQDDYDEEPDAEEIPPMDLNEVSIDEFELSITPADFDVLDAPTPDTELTIFGGHTFGAVTVDEVTVDLALPSNVQTALHLVFVWLWRLLFALGLWSIATTEYAYWSTLGGSAVG